MAPSEPLPTVHYIFKFADIPLFSFKQSNGHTMNGDINGGMIDEEEPKGGLEVLNDVITSLASQNYGNFNSSMSKWGNPVVPYRDSVSMQVLYCLNNVEIQRY